MRIQKETISSMELRKIIFILILFLAQLAISQPYTLASWNLYNFGKSKSIEEIAFIAETIKEADIIAIQEISEKFYGTQAVGRLVDELNRKGSSWDYAISDPTQGKGVERYAFLWRKNKFTLIKNAFLEKKLDQNIDREPFLAFLKSKSGDEILLANLHAVPKSKEPWKEIKYLHKLDDWYKKENIIIMGDFNLPYFHEGFDKLKERKIIPALIDTKTTIKIEPKNGEHLANMYDNFFYEAQEFEIQKAGTIDFTSKFETLRDARKISDHLPIFVVFSLYTKKIKK